MEFTKKDATITKGFAVICMLVLHLFCRKGTDVYGTPLIWLNKEVPFVYVFGLFAEVCVPIFSFCAGYAQSVLKQNEHYIKKNLKRILKLLINYWIILILFSALGLIFDTSGQIPGDWKTFIENVLLIKKYNGAWWYLSTYVLLILFSPLWITLLNKCKNNYSCLAGCVGYQLIWYVISHFVDLTAIAETGTIMGFCLEQINNLLGVISAFLTGILFHRENLIEKMTEYMHSKLKTRNGRNFFVIVGFLFMIAFWYFFEKSILAYFFSITSILLLKVMDKPRWFERIFLFLGKHSTNIWLIHMFFYRYIFRNLVFVVQYPILVLLFMIVLCVITSYIVMSIYAPIEKKIDRKFIRS